MVNLACSGYDSSIYAWEENGFEGREVLSWVGFCLGCCFLEVPEQKYKAKLICTVAVIEGHCFKWSFNMQT